MLFSHLDKYSLNARAQPALLFLLPVIISIFAIFPFLYDIVLGLLGLVVASVFITILTHLSRSRGKSVEIKLFKEWGGKPTTILLRHSNNVLDKHTKQRYHEFFAKNIAGWTSPTEEQELTNLGNADAIYNTATKWLLEKTRDTKTFNLLLKENISYGFRRNCLGLKPFGITSSLVSAACVGCIILISDKGVGFEQNIFQYISLVFSLLLLFWWIFIVKESWVEEAVYDYANRLLATCDQIKI